MIPQLIEKTEALISSDVDALQAQVGQDPPVPVAEGEGEGLLYAVFALQSLYEIQKDGLAAGLGRAAGPGHHAGTATIHVQAEHQAQGLAGRLRNLLEPKGDQ